MVRALALFVAIAALGCSGGSDCRDGSGCDGDCTTTGECVAAGTSVDLRITWTVNGERPNPQEAAPCADIGDLAVDLIDDSISEEIEFTPVSCDLGQITFVNLPPRIDRVRVSTFDMSANLLNAVAAQIPAGTDVEIEIDLFQ